MRKTDNNDLLGVLGVSIMVVSVTLVVVFLATGCTVKVLTFGQDNDKIDKDYRTEVFKAGEDK